MIKVNIRIKENIAILSYRLIEDLLYFNNNERDLRLCISIAIKAEVFKLTHNKIGYLGYTYTYKRLT